MNEGVNIGEANKTCNITAQFKSVEHPTCSQLQIIPPEDQHRAGSNTHTFTGTSEAIFGGRCGQLCLPKNMSTRAAGTEPPNWWTSHI